jgi:general stress protein 26
LAENQSFEEMSMHDHKHGNPDAKKLYELIKDVRVAMMTTVESDGTLRSRPMYSQSVDESGDLWFFTQVDTSKVTEISRDNQINLGYSHPGKEDYVSVSGTAEIVRDKAKIEEKWSEALKAWFPEGTDDPRIALLRVHPEKGEYWDSPSATVAKVYGYAKALLTGEEAKPGDHKKVDLHA